MRATVLALALSFGALEVAQAAPPPASAYGRLPAVSDVAISPDGAKLAIAINRPDGSFVDIMQLGPPVKPLRRATMPENNTLRGVRWASDAFAAAEVSQTLTRAQVGVIGGYLNRFEYARLVTIDLQTGRTAMMPMGLVAPFESDPGWGRALVPVKNTPNADLGVWRVSLRTGNAELDDTLPTNTWGAVFDAKAKVVVRTDARAASNAWDIAVPDGAGWRAIESGVSDTGAPPQLFGLFPDGRVAMKREEGEAKIETLHAIDLSTGATERRFGVEGFDIASAVVDPWTREVVGAAWTDALFPRQHFFDPTLEAARVTLAEMMEGGYAVMASWSKDRSRIVVFAEAGSAVNAGAGAYYLFDPAKKTLTEIQKAYPEIPVAAHAPVMGISYRARDKTRISAILTEPVGRAEAALLPLVVLVHGGPRDRDSASFDYWAQFLASRGYAVLQPNFRGSSGFGAAFERAGYGEWGGVMQTDVEDGVRALIRAKRVDPTRICIMGASYGGFAALAGPMLTPDLYRCAVGVNGVYDLPTRVEELTRASGSQSALADDLRSLIGDLKADRAELRAVSPTLNAGKITAPVLLMHGSDDSIVPIAESRRMQRALEEAGGKSAFVELTGEDHWLSDPVHRTRMLEEIERFLAVHNPAN